MKFNKHYKNLMAVIMIFYQTVFLFAPAIAIYAQNTGLTSITADTASPIPGKIANNEQQKPTLEIISPADKEEITSGLIEASAKSNAPIKELRFILSQNGNVINQNLANNNNDIWQYSWDAALLNDGVYNIMAKATTTDDKFIVISTPISITIKNAAEETSPDNAEPATTEEIKNDDEENLPAECAQANYLTKEACNKYLLENKPPAEILAENLPAECKIINIIDGEKCNLYLQQKYLTKECQDANAKTKDECDKIMLKLSSQAECAQAGYETESECRDYLANKLTPKIECQNIDQAYCQKAINERFLGYIAAQQAKYDGLKEATDNLIGQSLNLKDLKKSLGENQKMIPIKKESTNLKIVAMTGKITLDENDNLVQTAPMAFMIDSDQDGLPDSIEKEIGTDPFNVDTDSDGVTDLDEVKNNLNPLGPGQLAKTLSPINEAIVNNKPLGQPKTEGEIKNNYLIKSFINADENKGYILNGQAEPNSTITLYFYSDLPLVATVGVDKYGNWQYELDQSLIDGEHEVYVVLNDNTGKVVNKSNPLNFFVKEARAISVQEFVDTATSPAQTKSASLINFYLIIVILIITVGILLFIIFFLFHKNRRLKP